MGQSTSFAVTVHPTVETGSVVAVMHLADDASATRQARQYARLFDPDQWGGYGLRIITNTTTRWGTIPLQTGKQVWFELHMG